MSSEYEWNVVKWGQGLSIDNAVVGDVFAAQEIDTGLIEARYAKVINKKRGFQDLDERGFVSAYDIKSMHLPHCRIVHYANAEVDA